uniref:Diheme cytochrome c-553 n=1 Tax=Ignavibacterium album TaxID=591197 RepID=A0A7V3E8U5_9BACT
MFRFKIAFSIVVFTFMAVFIFSACDNSANEKKEKSHADKVARGEFLVTFGGCGDCHTPKVFTPKGPVLDTTKMLSGSPSTTQISEVDANLVKPGKWVLFTQDITAAVGPWGASFAANLTPDNETGIGSWNEEMFINAMRTGKHLGAGRPIMPPMPWELVGHHSDDDLKAMFAYLKSLKPVKNKVPDYMPPDIVFAQK